MKGSYCSCKCAGSSPWPPRFPKLPFSLVSPASHCKFPTTNPKTNIAKAKVAQVRFAIAKSAIAKCAKAKSGETKVTKAQCVNATSAESNCFKVAAANAHFASLKTNMQQFQLVLCWEQNMCIYVYIYVCI